MEEASSGQRAREASAQEASEHISPLGPLERAEASSVATPAAAPESGVATPRTVIEPPTSGLRRLSVSLRQCVTSVYFWACVVYLAYTIEQLAIDYCNVSISPDVYALAPAPAPAPGPAPAQLLAPAPPPGPPGSLALPMPALLGGTNDSHGCFLDGGYVWCATTSTCLRPWLSPCPAVAAPRRRLSDAPPAPSPPPPKRVWAWMVTQTCSETGYGTINRQYVASGAVHVVNAAMFAAAWAPWLRDRRRSQSRLALAVIALPELCNLVEASLYLVSSTHYAHAEKFCSTYRCDEYFTMHRLELAASSVELVASLGWLASWWLTHERGPGRGLSPWDVDLWNQLLLVASSVVYLVYNVQISRRQNEGWDGVHTDGLNYSHNKLFETGDVMYFVGAVLYLASAMRDCDFFFWLPALPFYPAEVAPEKDEEAPP